MDSNRIPSQDGYGRESFFIYSHLRNVLEMEAPNGIVSTIIHASSGNRQSTHALCSIMAFFLRPSPKARPYS